MRGNVTYNECTADFDNKYGCKTTDGGWGHCDMSHHNCLADRKLYKKRLNIQKNIT